MHETKKATDSKAMQWHREKRILEYHEKHQGEASVISFRGGNLLCKWKKVSIEQRLYTLPQVRIPVEIPKK